MKRRISGLPVAAAMAWWKASSSSAPSAPRRTASFMPCRAAYMVARWAELRRLAANSAAPVSTRARSSKM